jgi:hypothetical protein
MDGGTIRLIRTPLREGESLYTLSNIDQGIYTDGVHKDERKPKRQSVFPVILPDGRMCWEMLDNKENRAFCEAHLPTSENPPFAYSMEVGGVVPPVVVKPDPRIEDVEPETDDTPKRGRGRPKGGK